MAEDLPIIPPIEPSPAPIIEPPPIEAWIAYPTANPPQNHPVILNALSDDGWWNGFELVPWLGWWENKGEKIAEIIKAAVLDFREAYGAAFEEVAKNNPNLVPTSCLAYIDATIQYNICLRFDLYNLRDDGITRDPVKDYFQSAWKDASVYRRHIASTRKRYREDLNAPLTVDGTPTYISRTNTIVRSL